MSPTTCCWDTVASVDTAIACRHAFTKRKIENISIDVIITAIITSSSVKPRVLPPRLVWLRENIKCQGARLFLTVVNPGEIERHFVQPHDILFLLVLPL